MEPTVISAIEALGNAADWLQDSEERSLRQHRMAFIDGLGTAWLQPGDAVAMAKVREAGAALLAGLDQNRLYPHDILFGEGKSGDLESYMIPEDQLGEAFARLDDFCVDNKFGIAEVHILWVEFLLLRALMTQRFGDTHRQVKKRVEAIVGLSDPELRARNRTPFSEDCKRRLEALRATRVIRALGLDTQRQPDVAVNPDEIGEPVPPKRIREVERHILRRLRLAYRILAYGRFLEARRMKFPDDPWPEEVKDVKRAVRRVMRAHQRLVLNDTLSPIVRNRLVRITETLLVRSIAPFTPAVGLRVYSYLRSAEEKGRMHHGRMFALLRSASERLQLLNFLYSHGRRNPIHYIEQFAAFFPGDVLRFVSNEVGFALKSAETADAN